MGKGDNDKKRWIIIAGEEGGPISNKMGGIWEVIDAEANTLAKLVASRKINDSINIAVCGPFYPHKGIDWNSQLQRVTDISGLAPLEPDEELERTIGELNKLYPVHTGIKKVEGIDINYFLFDTCKCYWKPKDTEISVSDKIKNEAYDLLGLNSLEFENQAYGKEYTHYLELSHSISNLAQLLSNNNEVSMHCHEFGTFYAAARVERSRAMIKTICTFHATLPGRSWGSKTLEMIKKGDRSINEFTPTGLMALESMARYGDHVTFVGNSTRLEAKHFYEIDGIVIRNGIDVPYKGIDWEKKSKNREKIQKYVFDILRSRYNINIENPRSIIPFFTISRLELENKGYYDLLDSLVFYDHIFRSHVKMGEGDEETLGVCFLIASHGPKDKNTLPSGFPIYLPQELLVGDEIKLKDMVDERGLGIDQFGRIGRKVLAVVYPQWIGKDDGGLNMSLDEIASGCVASVFPSRYDPFLLTGLEAGREGTPVIVSRACGFSDAVIDYERMKGFSGGVEVVDNIDQDYNEIILDYALYLNSISRAFNRDRLKYKMMCTGAFQMAEDMSWEDPILKYYEILSH